MLKLILRFQKPITVRFLSVIVLLKICYFMSGLVLLFVNKNSRILAFQITRFRIVERRTSLAAYFAVILHFSAIMMATTNPKKPDKLKGNPMYDLPFRGAFVATLFSILLNFLAFCSPYWLESYPDTKEPFLRLGLWSICFDKFIHQKDNFGTEWTGCFWMFDWNVWAKGMWEWIDPPWLIAVQVVCGVSFICHCISLLCSLMHFMLLGSRSAESAICCGTQTVATVFLCMGVIIFGVKVEDRNWMPRPDHNHLSWSYAMAVLSCFASAISCVFLYMVYKNDKEDDNRMEGKSGFTLVNQAAPAPAMSAAGSVYAAGAARGQGQHTMSLHSGFSQGGYRSGAY